MIQIIKSYCQKSNSGRCRVQESDGSFFESYTSLAWRQENKRLRAASEDDKDYDRPPPVEIQFATKPQIQKPSRKEFELLYIEVLYTIKHKIGTTSGGHSPYIQDLFQYAKEAFGVSPEDHARLLAKATEEKPPIVILNVNVIEASNLEAKDADGFSDPYCMLGIMPGPSSDVDSGAGMSSDEETGKTRSEKERLHHVNSKKFSLRKKTKNTVVRDMLPAKLIKTTQVKPNTLNPVWNERFRFDLDDIHTDRLHLDIWDHDEEFSVVEAAKKLNEVSGFKGLGRFFKQVAQSARSKDDTSIDDFLGCVNIPLDDLPSTGISQWYKLEGRSSRSNIQGEIHLKLTLATREDRGIPEDDNWTDVRQHEDLMCIFIEYELRKYQDASYKWTGDLPQVARTILHQHAIQGDITEVQQAVCRWQAYSRKHMEHPLSYDLLHDLLIDLDRLYKDGTLSREEEETLAESFTNFIEYSKSLLRKMRDVYPPTNKTAITRLKLMLKCLSTIHVLEIFKKCCPFHSGLNSEIMSLIKKSTLEWYERTHSTYMGGTQNDEDLLRGLIELCNQLNSDVYKAYHNYNPLFVELCSVHYFQVTYKQLEKVMSAHVQEVLKEELGEELSLDIEQILKSNDVHHEPSGLGSPSLTLNTGLFELYMNLQEFSRYSRHLSASDIKQLSIINYYHWFKCAVSKWLAIAQHRSERRIKKAVEVEKVAQVDAAVKYSTSAVDVCCCFTQITEFWKQLAWPDRVGAYPFVYKLTEDICNGAKLYADLVHTKLTDMGYYDDEGQFDVTEELCITINNIEQVRRSLKPLPTLLDFSEIQQALELARDDPHPPKEATTGLLGKASLQGIIKQADEDMIRKILQVVDRVADKMRPDIKKDVFHLNWAPESLPAEEAVEDLLEYLDSNLLTLNSNLLKTNFERILSSIWIEVLEEFREVLDTEEMRPPVFYQRMFQALTLLVDFFYANGNGLEMEAILIESFQNLRKELTMHKMDTKSLIETFYMEKNEQQAHTQSTEYGQLQIRAVYKYDSHKLLVEVLSAKDLIPLDANGLSDPYVLVSLVPEHVFPGISTQSTKIVKKTLNPVFDESFEFHIQPAQCAHHGATLTFTVMDHDLLFQNDFGGEAFLPLTDVSGVGGEEISGYDVLNVISLPLIHPKISDRGALNVLRRRTWDATAQDFIKKRYLIEQQAK
ncbi:BAI1-associated protein 3-like isoform X3 [Biomphalaria glabrata]|uniref:BAI1-associated protein 3-like isoform X3 n=1 Tax=Biomphalaria glabrata TaxID=6526 RepID=A0A9W2ZK60_BIOGL|nr:BAI1-associated protein 3-like isoform X3 [Biomphalaria glabrata]XP_055875421.1 BAI1-associated protein 3-like isoform X3 [Biomphalaria glabrata]XP_055875422.1 BAI1-associated protein 3-like isoform X3 [Biomphalaria glabrata]